MHDTKALAAFDDYIQQLIDCNKEGIDGLPQREGTHRNWARDDREKKKQTK